MKDRFYFLLSVTCFMLAGIVVSLPVLGQKASSYKALGLPDILESPIDYFGNDELYHKYIGDDLLDSKRSTKTPWIVYSDRSDNPTYNSSTGNPVVKTTLKFGEPCYVINQNRDWVEIVRGGANYLEIVDQPEYLGWIPKDKMLLWSAGLVNSVTHIHQKAFLLNKVREIDKDNLGNDELVPIFDGPSSSHEVPPIAIYRYFFVMKKKEGKYLISELAKIGKNSVAEKLIGWVQLSRCVDWNTRIAYEPNILPAAFEERKNNPKYRVKGYDKRESAQLHSSGIPGNGNVDWGNDPVIADASLLSPQNPYRFKGSVVRFPMLSTSSKATGDVVYTGAVGDIEVHAENGKLVARMGQSDFNEVQEAVKVIQDNKQNVNVLYIVEGSPQMGKYKESVKELFRLTKNVLPENPNLKVGMVVYRDISERKMKMDLQILSLTPKEEIFRRFTDSIYYTTWYDEDEYNNLRQAIHEGIESVGFDAKQTNIIIVLGTGPDFATNSMLRENAVAEHDPALFKTMDITNDISKINASIYFIQCMYDVSTGGSAFKKFADDILTQIGVSQFTKNSPSATDLGITLVEPVLVDDADNKTSVLRHGALPGFNYIPANNTSITNNELKTFCNDALSSTMDFVKGFQSQFITKVIDQGQSIESISHSAGEFSMAVVVMFNTILNSKNVDLKASDLNQVMKTKLQLFKDMYMPFQIKGASYPALSYTLFMPESELKDYIENLQKVQVAADESGDAEKREKLFGVFKSLIKHYSGNRDLPDSEIKQMNLKQLQELMNGVKDEGLRLPEQQEFILGNILFPNKVSPAEVNAWVERLNTKLKNLIAIRKAGKNYPFSFSIGEDTYYWITLDESL